MFSISHEYKNVVSETFFFCAIYLDRLQVLLVEVCCLVHGNFKAFILCGLVCNMLV